MTDRDSGRPGDGASARRPGRRHIEDVEERAARLGITVERVLQELAGIGFARITDIVEWDESGIRFNSSHDISDDDRAVVAEIVASAKDGTPYRIKLHDKKGALEAIGRYLYMFPKLKPARKEERANEDGEDPRDTLERRLARLAASLEEGEVPPVADAAGS